MKTRFASTFSFIVATFFLVALIFGGCAKNPAALLPPPPPKYVSKGPSEEPRTANSLWRETSSILEDFRARRVNDLLTINVLESISGSGGANTATGRKSSIDASVNAFFGVNNLEKFQPAISAEMGNDFKGKGTTNRTGTIIGTITARVVEVMPNGTLEVESRKDITINNEKQTMVLRGSVRPDDISVTNTIPSTKVADAEIFLVGDGVLQDKQKPGWFISLFDRYWPF